MPFFIKTFPQVNFFLVQNKKIRIFVPSNKEVLLSDSSLVLQYNQLGKVMSDNSFSDNLRKTVDLWIKSGEDRYFTQIYSKMYKGLYGHIFKFVRDEDVTMDILSDTFIVIINKKQQYDPERGHFTTWAYNIAKNTALAYLNHEKKQEENRRNGSQFIYNLIGNSASNFHPEDNKEEKESVYTNAEYYEKDENLMSLFHQRAIQEIMSMSDTYKPFLYDRQIRNLSYQEISTKHNIKMNTVKSKIRLGREIIKLKLVEYGKSIGIPSEALSKMFG